MAHIAEVLAFWGKARPVDGDGPRSHSVAYHSLDVAAVAGAVLGARPVVRDRIGALLGLSPADVTTLVVALVSLHDLGKFSPAFQAKAPEHWPGEILGLLEDSTVGPGHHSEDGWILWDAGLEDIVVERLWPAGHFALHALAPAIFGHHGRPVAGMVRGQTLRDRYPTRAVGAAFTCANLCLDLLAPVPIEASGPVRDEDASRVSWLVSGLITVADWIGSSERWFQPYVAPIPGDELLEEYWALAANRAEIAVREAGIMVPTAARPKSFRELTNLSDATPTQRWAEATVLPDGPVLLVLEDVTGSGKTEAAQMLVHRLMSAGRATGAYWAMPTQATANAMYDRQAKTLDALFEDPERTPSLVLAHGQQRLHAEFRATVLDGAPAPGLGFVRDPAARGEREQPPASVACAAWLADDRRAAMLADIGAGTIDQALLGILPSRFNTMRLFGLAGKVLVVDEAHAYDAYMGVELAELLRFHAALGGSAIVLSATLPAVRRAALVSGWQDGMLGGQRRLGRPPALESGDYPLTTVVAGNGVCEARVDPAPRSIRTVSVQLVHDVDAVFERVVELASVGAAVAWIRNTVDDCLHAAAGLRERGLEPLVFHARFAQTDRQSREREVMERFGKDAPDALRRGQVLVATQVIEQSLDLDFDAMMSDIAPVDLLVQRAGRLQRHETRDGTRAVGRECTLTVLSPLPDRDPPPDWLAGIFAGTLHVYPNIGVLWRTVMALEDTKAIRTPDGLRKLIEAVYGCEDVPDSLLPIAQRAEGDEKGNAAAAAIATLKVPLGYDSSQGAWINELRVMTRIGRPHTTVRLARVCGDGSFTPWAQHERPAWKAWALSEVRLSSRKVPPDAMPEPKWSACVAAAKSQWGKFEQEIPVLPLEQVGDQCWRGVLVHNGATGHVVARYTSAAGLEYEMAE